MTPSEIAFLALGLVLGSAAGAAIAQTLARRPGPRRQVRVTIEPNAIPSRRAYTLAVPNGFALVAPLPGSPDARARDDGLFDDAPPPVPPRSAAIAVAPPRPDAGTPPTRTPVPSPAAVLRPTAVSVPLVRVAAAPAWPVPGGTATTRPDAAHEAQRPAPVARPAPVTVPGAITTIAVLDAPAADDAPAPAADGVPAAAPLIPSTPILPEATAAPSALPGFRTLVRPRRPVEPTRPALSLGALAVPVLRPVAIGGGSPGGAGSDRGGSVNPDQPPADDCAPARRLVDERCAFADAAREQARTAADALRDAQRQYDALRERVDRAQATADPRQVAAAKERLHAEFRGATDRAGTADETEAAARVWLHQINDLNAAIRDAQRLLEAGNADLRAQVPVLDRLAAEADAARIAGENADAGCRDARQELAACEESEARARAAIPVPPPEEHPFDAVWPGDRPELPDRDAPADLLAGLPVIVRILRGDRDARQRLVASLASADGEDDRVWQLRISRLVDAIAARTIEDGYLDVPEDHAFWRLFEPREARDIVRALSALGYRYDGLGGFADGRVPPARDLSLAVGYAGLDRMRIRTWPRDAEIERLYERAIVASDEWLADQASDLSLGRMVDALGNRAAELADLWNAWGRVRPLLLES